jgi:ubiquinone/menaquinone biosynthesis C-methylase UbiE/uncharacterized protein YbaR (Trm112 family)
MPFSLKYLFQGPSVADERAWERENVRAKTERYLATNPLDRFAEDPAYRAKVEATLSGLGPPVGPVLDLGGNTAGEATILQQRGHAMVVGDINEYALALSRQRAERFALIPPLYVALDAHRLPFADGSFAAVTVLEALHHFPDWSRVLAQIHRVLAPGGRLFSLEPNARNPLRRASEVRDRLRGTIEKSFTASQLRRLCRAAGFTEVQVTPFAVSRSEWKLRERPVWRRPLARFHGWLCVHCPAVFAAHRIVAQKPGTLPALPPPVLRDLLRSPLSGAPLTFDTARRGWIDPTAARFFPDHDGIPNLIPDEAQPL